MQFQAARQRPKTTKKGRYEAAPHENYPDVCL